MYYRLEISGRQENLRILGAFLAIKAVAMWVISSLGLEMFKSKLHKTIFVPEIRKPGYRDEYTFPLSLSLSPVVWFGSLMDVLFSALLFYCEKERR